MPISKNASRFLPKDRSYTELEALYSLQLDSNNNTEVTVSGYSSLWRWSRGKVSRFLETIGAVIEYPDDTRNQRNRRGHIMIHKPDIERTKDGHIRFIDSNNLGGVTDIRRTKDGHKASIRQGTTKDTDTKTDKDTKTLAVLEPEITTNKLTGTEVEKDFLRLWKLYPKKEGKRSAVKSFKASVKNAGDLQRITKALENYKAVLAAEPTRPTQHGSTWFKTGRIP